MTYAETTRFVVLGLIAARVGAQYLLDHLNRRHVQANAGRIPPAAGALLDASTYERSVRYTLAKSRFFRMEIPWEGLLLAGVLFSGILPWWRERFASLAGDSTGADALFLILTVLLFSLPNWPLDYWRQFRLEARFGFNTTTVRLWWMDRLKGTLLSFLLGFPLVFLLLKLADGAGSWWWVWGWGCVFGFQLLMIVLAPALIMPLFNKFTPLPPGTLRERLLALASRTGFTTRQIQIMDGSKRSRHSNAFFTGFGRHRKIVLFDTLIDQLSEPQLEAVLAHEIGHDKKGHLLKMMGGSGLGLMAGFAVLGYLSRQSWFFQAFGFPEPDLTLAFLLVGFLSGLVTFWIQPIINLWSRRWEYQADAYGAEMTGGPGSLQEALRILNVKNLSNLTPHPAYSRFYYSHPTLLERDQALARLGASQNGA
jgi:STE24 endopeptidase